MRKLALKNGKIYVEQGVFAQALLAEDGVITAEIFPNADYCKDMDKEAVAQALNELIKEINTTVTSAKTIRRIRMRDVEFDKTTSKKIRRQQAVKGDII